MIPSVHLKSKLCCVWKL